MELITYNEALTELCDNFDSLISPRTISRSNTNIIYLLFKAFAKGWEIVNNVCVTLSNKFNPASCSDEDLESVAFLVGTERRKGASSGLTVTAVNNDDINPQILPAGTYTYMLDEQTLFQFETTADISVTAQGSTSLMFLSTSVGSFHVTAQTDITVTAVDSDDDSPLTIPSQFQFANADNTLLLGYGDETDLEFRKRILSDTERQDTIKELELKLRNLPYVFDCNIVFNPTSSDATVGSYTIKPFYMLILLSTAKYEAEIAEIIAESGIYPSVNVTGVSHELQYESGIFADGHYSVYVNDFDRKQFTATVTYHADPNYISSEQAESTMRAGIFSEINSNRHTDRVTTEDFYSIINSLNVKGVSVLGIQLYENSQEKVYIDFLKTEIAELTTLTFSEV